MIKENTDVIPLPYAFSDPQMGGMAEIAAGGSRGARDVARLTTAYLHPVTSAGAEARNQIVKYYP